MAEFMQQIVELFLDMRNGFIPGIWETLYSSILSTLFAYAIGLPLGIFLVVGEAGGIRPMPRILMSIVNVIVNLLRSVPFLILMILVLPLSQIVLGTTIGTPAAIIPLVIAAFPFVARMVESSIREVDKGVIEAAQAMGASTFQIIWKVIIPESLPSLISGATISLTTILGYGAMAGIIGGGGLGKIALNYGYYRFNMPIMIVAVILLIIMVQIFQSIGTYLAVKTDKRITQRTKRRKTK